MADIAYKKRILLTDDDAGIRDSIGMMLEYAGYEPLVYSNGNDLLEGNYPKPDLFLLDKQLAGVSGLDICRHLKSKEESRQQVIGRFGEEMEQLDIFINENLELCTR